MTQEMVKGFSVYKCAELPGGEEFKETPILAEIAPHVVSVGTLTRALSEAYSLIQMPLLFLQPAFLLAVHWESPLCLAQRVSITVDLRSELGERAVIEMAFGRHSQSGTFQILLRSIFKSGIKKNCIKLFFNTPIFQKVKLRDLGGLPSWW